MRINQPDTPTYTKPEVEAEIQDGGGGHLGIFKTQLLSQLLTDFDKIYTIWTRFCTQTQLMLPHILKTRNRK
jgi:hypothetical protein